jgi:hypothetical protein
MASIINPTCLRTAAFLVLGFAATLSHAQRIADRAPLSARTLAVQADAPRATPHLPGAEPDEAELLSHRHDKANNGHEVHAPAKSTHDHVPAGASAQCRDGSYSFSQHRRGTCSHHGGVGAWL